MADDTYSRGYRNDPYDRGGTGASGPATDPLTELARLIGQSDPFAVDGNRRADPRGQPADWQTGAAQQAPQYDTDAQGAYDDRYGGAPQQQYADNGYAAQPGEHYANDPQHDAGYQDGHGHGGQAYHQDPQPYFGQQDGAGGQPGYDPSQPNAHGGYDAPPAYFGADHRDQQDEYYDDAPGPRRRGWLVTAAALIGLSVIGTAGAFAYRAVFTGGTPSIITRDIGPSKIVPAPANADSKQIDRLANGGQDERLAPPPEQPISIPDPARTAPPPVIGSNMGPAFPVTPGAANQPAPPAVTAAPVAPATGGGAPRKIRTVTIKSDQAGADSGSARPAPRSVAPTQSIQPPRVAAPAEPNAPLSLAPQGMSNPPAPPMHTTALAPPAPVAEGGGGGGGYFVQVSAQKTQDEAKSSFRSLKARYASVLGGHNAVYRRKDLGSKGVFYGAQVGPFSREGAAQLCESLKSAGGSCMIQRN